MRPSTGLGLAFILVLLGPFFVWLASFDFYSEQGVPPLLGRDERRMRSEVGDPDQVDSRVEFIQRARENGYRLRGRALAGACPPFQATASSSEFVGPEATPHDATMFYWYSMFMTRAVIFVVYGDGLIRCVLLGGT